MKTIEVKTTPMFQTDLYEKNYDRNPYAEHICACCGRKLNPKTMKFVQSVEPGYFIDYDGNFEDIYTGDETRQVNMGCWEVGPICYKEIRRRLSESATTRTLIVE